MTSIWFTSDPHFGHRRVAELRGFNSVEAHDATLIDRWRAVVRPDDQVWVLGDVVVSESSLDHGLAILRALPGVKDLVAGNHDACHPMHRRAHLAFATEHGFDQIVAVGDGWGMRFVPTHPDRWLWVLPAGTSVPPWMQGMETVVVEPFIIPEAP